MFSKSRRIIESLETGTLKDMCLDILSRTGDNSLLKISFFHHAACDSEYLAILNTLCTTVKEFFPCNTPLVSYIAQGTERDMLVAEVTYLTDTGCDIQRHDNYILLTREGCKEIMTGGIVPHDIAATAYEQSTEIFAIIGKILASNGFAVNDIYRQWNYIQYITAQNDGSQNYQEFNDARSIFYSSCDWPGGYPAATGIGTSAGGVMVELCAISGKGISSKPIDNPLQIAAHSYSQNVLDGKVIETLTERTTPKFERARLLGNTIYISGTAAIKGEESNSSTCAAEQTAETMEIMDRLVSKENIPAVNNGARYNTLRVYVKRASDIAAVKEFMEEHYPVADKHYLIADICRPELLVEIEGIAHI